MFFCGFCDFFSGSGSPHTLFQLRLLYLLLRPALVFLSCQLLRVVSPIALMAELPHLLICPISWGDERYDYPTTCDFMIWFLSLKTIGLEEFRSDRSDVFSIFFLWYVLILWSPYLLSAWKKPPGCVIHHCHGTVTPGRKAKGNHWRDLGSKKERVWHLTSPKSTSLLCCCSFKVEDVPKKKSAKILGFCISLSVEIDFGFWTLRSTSPRLRGIGWGKGRDFHQVIMGRVSSSQLLGVEFLIGF